MTFIPIATTEEISNASSFINAGFSYPQDEYNGYFLSLGEALATWAQVEGKLLAIFCAAIGGDVHVAPSIFHSGDGFRAKLKMVDAACQGSGKIPLKEWNIIKEKLSGASSKRNDLAHHTTYYDHHGSPDRKFFLASGSSIESRKYLSDIVHLQSRFGELIEALDNLWGLSSAE